MCVCVCVCVCRFEEDIDKIVKCALKEMELENELHSIEEHWNEQVCNYHYMSSTNDDDFIFIKRYCSLHHIRQWGRCY